MSPKAPKHHRPEDDPEPGTPGTGEDICPDCHGTGKQVDEAGKQPMSPANTATGQGSSPKRLARQRVKRGRAAMSACGTKQTWGVALHMSAFGGKADMAFCGNPLSRSLLRVKRTSAVAPHMSACDPKRTWAGFDVAQSGRGAASRSRLSEILCRLFCTNFVIVGVLIVALALYEFWDTRPKIEQ